MASQGLAKGRLEAIEGVEHVVGVPSRWTFSAESSFAKAATELVTAYSAGDISLPSTTRSMCGVVAGAAAVWVEYRQDTIAKVDPRRLRVTKQIKSATSRGTLLTALGPYGRRTREQERSRASIHGR